MSGTPALPREVWVYAWTGGYISVSLSLAEATSNHTDDAGDLEPDELSPIGRYVLADDARERLRDAVIAEVAAAYVDGADHGDLADAYKELITYEDGR